MTAIIMEIINSYQLKINNKYFKYDKDKEGYFFLLKHDGTYENKKFERVDKLDIKKEQVEQDDNFILGSLLYHYDDDYCFISNSELEILKCNVSKIGIIASLNKIIVLFNVSEFLLLIILSKIPYTISIDKLATNPTLELENVLVFNVRLIILFKLLFPITLILLSPLIDTL